MVDGWQAAETCRKITRVRHLEPSGPQVSNRKNRYANTVSAFAAAKRLSVLLSDSDTTSLFLLVSLGIIDV